jgi:hypothetical protein
MISFLKKVWRDKRGNALIIAGAAMPLVVGSAGLATDTVQWVVWKRGLQRAADSAAFAGVYASAQESSVSDAVDADLDNNNKTGVTLATGYPQIAYPTSTDWTSGVRVTLAVQKRLGFSSMFMSAAPTITATATAAMVDDGVFCAGAMKKTGAAITIGGSSSVNLGCNAISNSTGTPAVSTNGNNYSFVAPMVAAAGSLPTAITGVTTLKPRHLPMKDPFASKYSTDVPPGVPCSNFNTHRTNLGTGANPNYHLSPGCYTSFAPNGNNTYTLDPGVYYLKDTSFVLNGSDTLIGSGVTIVLTGTTPGNVQTNGTSTVKLSAPTATNCGTYSGTNTCNYKNMLFIQSPSATADNNNTINGTNASNYDGAMYFPKGQITFNGNSGGMTKCAMVIAYTLNFSGNTNLQNNTTGCNAATTVPGKVVRLVG